MHLSRLVMRQLHEKLDQLRVAAADGCQAEQLLSAAAQMWESLREARAQHGHQQHIVIRGHEHDQAWHHITGCHLVFVLLVDGQLLQEGCGQYEQLDVGAVQHFDQVLDSDFQVFSEVARA
ncbi:MAG: hypothetical protein FRX49_10273 [Trebouxia sp. A1-2]|nr:MAG: hypothetical protein FRX49_10273 [Trebouxia sp. A1-2]